jgi:nucleotide-binding universal stress UspA family protein
MKILICTDGSEESLKAMEAAAGIATGCQVSEVAVIHVYESRLAFPFWGEGYSITAEDLERFKAMDNKEKEKRKKVLEDAEEFFTGKGLSIKKIFKEGHPSETIAEVAREGGYDIVVLGSRGLGGLKKLLLGSVSNAVVQQLKTSVLVVK